MSSYKVSGLVPKEEIESVKKEYDRKYPFPSCESCKHKQIIVLKYRKYKGKITIKDSTEKCDLNLETDSSLRRAVKCVGYEAGENQYIIEKKYVDWVDEQIETLRFRNRSHAIEYALAKFIELEREGNE